MHRTVVMMPEPLWREVQALAQEQGMSGSQLVRLATIAFIFYERGKESDADLARAIKLATSFADFG